MWILFVCLRSWKFHIVQKNNNWKFHGHKKHVPKHHTVSPHCYLINDLMSYFPHHTSNYTHTYSWIDPFLNIYGRESGGLESVFQKKIILCLTLLFLFIKFIYNVFWYMRVILLFLFFSVIVGCIFTSTLVERERN